MTERLTEVQISDIWNAMPGGHKGFLKEWGYMQFAKAIEEAILGPEKDFSDLDTLKAELKWCLENNAGPRTECALRWALELVEEMEEKGGEA